MTFCDACTDWDGDHSDGSLGSLNERLEDVTMDDNDAEAELEESQLPASPKNCQQPDAAIPVSPGSPSPRKT